MPIAYIVHADQDQDYVHHHLAQTLPPLGYPRWIASQFLPADISPARAMAASAAVLAVVSNAAARTERVRLEVTAALTHAHRVIPMQIDGTAVGAVTTALATRAAIDAWYSPHAPRDMVASELAVLLEASLPAAREMAADPLVASVARAAPWNEQVYSELLERALSRHDYTRTTDLVTRLTNHLRAQSVAYGTPAASRDLGALRRRRQFALMQHYAEAVLASGTDDFQVRRQYAQALIELGEYEHAIVVLTRIVDEAGRTHPESYEARGLLGRTYKQRYVNAPSRDAARLMRSAVEWYLPAFQEDPRMVWHGINAATCLRRCEHDGLDIGVADDPVAISREVLDSLASMEKERSLPAFELATRVEALALLGDFDSADLALTEYLAHPGAHAFEVSSTHRQFEEVLQLQRHERGKVLVDRLWDAVLRQRAPISLRASEGNDRRVPVLVSVTDRAWQPTAAGCEILGRMGAVVAMECDRHAIKTILADPLVLDIAESRKTNDANECARSVPYIGVATSYPCTAGTFEERGKHALIAVIDDGIDVLHEAFLDGDGQSRIVGIWDQRDGSGRPPDGFTLGTYHDAAAIARYVADKKVPDALGRNTDGHGTHVASIAAGRKAGDFAGGVAPEARILVVITDAADSIGYSLEHVAALQCIGRVADTLKVPVVVNVSQGMNAGAHDGRSPLENAFDAFSESGSKPGRVVVKSAGNGGQANGHALIQVAKKSRVTVQWQRARDPEWEYEYVEFWWNSANTYRFSLIAPSGAKSEVVDVRSQSLTGELDECPFRMQLVRRHRYNGDSQLVVEIGSVTNNAIPVPHGTWKLEITHADGDAPGVIHGWIERGPRTPSEFLAPHSSSEMTLTVPGTAHSVITVGAVAPGDDDTVDTPPFTANGPTRDNRSKPDVSAPGLNIMAARGGSATGAMTSDGTSMAAPHVAGAIALLMSRAVAMQMELPTSAQINPVLQQKTRNRSGHWNPAQGFGVIDVAGLLAAFE